MMKKLKTILHLFATMFKIGAFTFGGGYAMLALLENEFVEKKKWLEKEEFLDMVEDGTDLASGFEARRAGEIINSVLATVGRTNKDIFILRYWLGLSLAQIAAQTGYGESKIKVSLHRTRKKIAAQLKKEGITK